MFFLKTYCMRITNYTSILLNRPRWHLRPKKIDYLCLAIAHIQYLPPVLRAVVAEEICETTVFPLLRLYLDIEDSHSRWMPQGSGKISQHSQEVRVFAHYDFVLIIF